MTIPEPTKASPNDFTPVTRESFLEASCFYTALASKGPEDKLVLIRLPAEISASDLDFQSVQLDQDLNQVSGIFNLNNADGNNNNSKITQNSSSRSTMRRSPRLCNTYSIRASPKDLQVSALSLAEPLSAGVLADTQRVRLSRTFDAFWTVGAHVDVPLPPISRIKKAVQKRAAKPLVEQPKNLRMRLLPFSTPRSSKPSKPSKSSKTH